MSMYKDVYNQVNNQGSPATFAKVLQGRKILVDNLAPLASRTANLNTQDNVDLVDALKGLFNDRATIAKQHREGFMGRTAGFDFMENTLWPSHVRSAANGSYLINGASQTGATLTVDTGANAPAAGDVFTIAGVFRVHPETKQSTGILQQFVVGTGATATSWPISPAIVITGALQNVSGAPQTQIPIEASRPCELYRVPAEPSMVDLEVGYLKRGEQLVACDAARQLAVQIHLIEHEFEAQQQRQGGREGFRLWSRR
jgi:hypothetical protein